MAYNSDVVLADYSRDFRKPKWGSALIAAQKSWTADIADELLSTDPALPRGIGYTLRCGHPAAGVYEYTPYEIAARANAVEAADALKVLVFESANPDYFIAHYDM